MFKVFTRENNYYIGKSKQSVFAKFPLDFKMLALKLGFEILKEYLLKQKVGILQVLQYLLYVYAWVVLQNFDFRFRFAVTRK